MSQSPAFQFYPQDFLVGSAYMTAEETGAYIRLLCYQWSNNGIPDDDAKLAVLGGCSGNAVASIRHKFGMCRDGKLFNIRLENVRAEQDKYRAKQAEKAVKRWQNHTAAIPEQCSGNATALPVDMPEACPSSSPSSSITTAVGSAEKPKRKKKPQMTDDEWVEQLKTNPAYSHLNINIEVGKAQAWVSAQNGRMFTRRFFVGWLNRATPKAEKPMAVQQQNLHLRPGIVSTTAANRPDRFENPTDVLVAKWMEDNK